MIRQDQDNNFFQSLKNSFGRMTFLEKMKKSKSEGESLNVNDIDSLSTNSNTKEEIYKINQKDTKNINSIIMESCDSTYEIDELEELNLNYYSTLLEYGKSQNIKEPEPEEKSNDEINIYKKEGGAIVIDEFLQNLSQNIDNKTDVLSTFEDFLKQGQKWPKFSESDIIKLYVGNNVHNYNYNSRKNDEKFNSFFKNFSVNNIIKKESEDHLLRRRKISSNYEQNQKQKLIEVINDSDENISILRGLFYYIGDFDNNILLSLSCLNLLVKLLDIEFNPEYDIYLRLFKNRRISDYQTMKLEEIIKNNKGGVKARTNSFKLLSILMGGGTNKKIIEKNIIKDETIIDQLDLYNNYG